MYTEAEAKTKWCPFTRPGHGDGCNRFPGDFGAHARCIASNCMAWRTLPAQEAEFELAANYSTHPPGEGLAVVSKSSCGRYTSYSRETKPSRPETGFCGAFGPAKAGAA